MRKLAILSIILIGFAGSSEAGLVTLAGACGDTSTPISEIQGAGAASPHAGVAGVVVEAVVVGDFQGPDRLRGFYLQDSDADKDSDPLTSNGIFVFDDAAFADVDLGDVVRVQGKVTEFFHLTELTALTRLAICSRGNALPKPTALSLPVAEIEDFERVEGMRVIFPGSLQVTDNSNLARRGEIGLAVGGPLENPTSVVAPGAAANAMQALNDRSRIQLDDGSNIQFPQPPPYFGADNSLRIGDTVTDLETVMSFGFGSYRLQPVGAVNFARSNPRTDIPDASGALRVASFNLHNYFTTPGDRGSICGPSASRGCRGADNAAEFLRQREKLLAAIGKLDADVLGLAELENDSADGAIADLVAGLNAIARASVYDFVATGTIGSDAIRVGFIYKPGSVTPLGRALLDTSVDARFDDSRNRPALAQTFVDNGSGETFTLLQVHLKSKGTPCDDVGDADTGDGQGNCNLTRVNAVLAIRDWLATDPTASGSDKFMILGDLNAYAREDPVAALRSAGYVDLVEMHVGSGFADGAHSYSFSGQAGRLDHALASPAMASNVTGLALWHINADEPPGLDYNDFNQPGLYRADEFRSSDHDPIVIDLFGERDAFAPGLPGVGRWAKIFAMPARFYQHLPCDRCAAKVAGN